MNTRSHKWVKIKKGKLSRLQRYGHISDDLKVYIYKEKISTLWNVEKHVDSCEFCFKLVPEMLLYGRF